MTPQECDAKWPQLKGARVAAKFGIWEEAVRVYNRIWMRDKSCYDTQMFNDPAYNHWLKKNQGVHDQIMREVKAEYEHERETRIRQTTTKKKKETS